MQNKSSFQYDFEALEKRLPEDHAEMFIGFIPWTEDAKGWSRSVKEDLIETATRTVKRTIWDNPEVRDERVLIDVVECLSPLEALNALKDRLLWNQLARLDEGPEGLGYAAFQHPDGVPPGLFFARGNLCISIMSFGKLYIDVNRWAENIARRLDFIPSIDRATISLRAKETKIKIDQTTDIEYDLPWQYGEEGYTKFLVSNGRLEQQQDRLVFIGVKKGEARIQVYLLEPGRELHAGYQSIVVE